MPLTLTITKGVLPVSKVKEAVSELTDSMLKWHGLTGNSVMTPNVTANAHFVEAGLSFSGGKEFEAVWVEWKVPSFAFASSEILKGFGKDATDIIYNLTGGKVARDNIYFNVVHTVDGAWNLDGIAMTNEELGQAIAKGASA
ncbi:MAG: 4-oxalocrotonate tautomerase [Phycisphaerales bacterium]